MSYERIGDVAKAQGDLPAARTAFQDGLEIFERLAKADPSNTGFQRDLAVSYEKMGDIDLAQGNLSEAKNWYERELDIGLYLKILDSTNINQQSFNSVIYGKIGDVAKAQGDLTAARSAYLDGLEIAERLAKADPENAEWQRDVMAVRWRLAGLDGEDAPEHWRAAYRVLKALDEAGRMQPVDREWLGFLEQKMEELED